MLHTGFLFLLTWSFLSLQAGRPAKEHACQTARPASRILSQIPSQEAKNNNKPKGQPCGLQDSRKPESQATRGQGVGYPACLPHCRPCPPGRGEERRQWYWPGAWRRVGHGVRQVTRHRSKGAPVRTGVRQRGQLRLSACRRLTPCFASSPFVCCFVVNPEISFNIRNVLQVAASLLQNTRSAERRRRLTPREALGQRGAGTLARVTMERRGVTGPFARCRMPRKGSRDGMASGRSVPKQVLFRQCLQRDMHCQ